MAVIIIPVAVSVHTIVSWDFAMAIAPMWHSTIFGPYFVAGAIYSGIAVLIVAMVILRRVLCLEAYLQPLHFNYLGLLLLTMACAWLYFTFAEHLTTWYGRFPEEMVVLQSKISGPFAWLFWTMVATCFLLPVPILAFPRTRTIVGCFVASVCVLVGMWLERFLIIVPTLSYPRLLSAQGMYIPTWVELSITVGTFATFALLYVLFTKLFPIISIWEVKEPALSLPILSLSKGETAFAPEAEQERKSRIPWFALAGGLIGGAVGLSLAALTSLALRLPTGGMPIIAWPTIGIVTFELTALGAIVATLSRFLWEGSLPAMGQKKPNPIGVRETQVQQAAPGS
jgi:molybdopterin-containing oxidoreductase family membrane subunit